MRTFADWHEPLPGSMEMDLVAHCGAGDRGSYVHSLVFDRYRQRIDEAAPLVVRESSLVVETLQASKPDLRRAGKSVK